MHTGPKVEYRAEQPCVGIRTKATMDELGADTPQLSGRCTPGRRLELSHTLLLLLPLHRLSTCDLIPTPVQPTVLISSP